MPKIPEPQIERRSWTFAYARPARMGWPTLVRTGLPSAISANPRPAKRIAPKRFRITVRWSPGAEPYVDTVSVTGNWADSGKPVIGTKVHHDARPGFALSVYADDNVRELMADAIQRAALELGVTADA